MKTACESDSTRGQEGRGWMLARGGTTYLLSIRQTVDNLPQSRVDIILISPLVLFLVMITQLDFALSHIVHQTLELKQSRVDRDSRVDSRVPMQRWVDIGLR
jgi:hypothetical protein